MVSYAFVRDWIGRNRFNDVHCVCCDRRRLLLLLLLRQRRRSNANDDVEKKKRQSQERNEHTHNHTCVRCDFVLTGCCCCWYSLQALRCHCGAIPTPHTDVQQLTTRWTHQDDALSPFTEPSHYWFGIFFSFFPLFSAFSICSERQNDIFRLNWRVLSLPAISFHLPNFYYYFLLRL